METIRINAAASARARQAHQAERAAIDYKNYQNANRMDLV